MICDLTPIHAANAADFLSLVSPQDADRLRQIDCNGFGAAIGATVFARPVGLIYAVPASQPRIYRVTSFSVAPAFRHRGIGAALLQAFTQHLTARDDCDYLMLSYCRPENTPPTPCDALIKNIGGTTPMLTSLVVKLSCEQYLKAHWHNTFRFSPGYRFFLWRETTAAQRAAFQAQFGDQPCFPEGLSPFGREDQFEPINSIGLTYHDRLVGWMMSERLDAQTFLFARVFVIPELQHFGKYFLQLVYESVVHASRHRLDYGMFIVDAANTRMRQLLDKRLRPYVGDIREQYCAFIATMNVNDATPTVDQIQHSVVPLT